ncbi:MAG: hypothetical protein ACRYGP_00140 [Janthinobacterium lividum]
MVANLATGRLSGSIGNLSVIFVILIALIIVMALMPAASANLWTTVIAVAAWGALAWGLLVPQQHRPVAVATKSAPVVPGINTSCTYLGVTAAGVIGALGLPIVGAHDLGYVGAISIVVTFGAAEWATLKINASIKPTSKELATA